MFANAAAHLEPGGCFVVEVGVHNRQRLEVFDLSDTHVGVDELDFDTQRLVSHHFSLVDGAVAADLGAVPLRLAGRARPDGAAGRDEAARALGGLGPLALHGGEHEARLRLGEGVRIELPIETERLVIRPLELADAADLGEPEEWIREKIDRFERDGGMSLWATVERESGRAVALAGLQWEQIDGRRELDLGCVVATHAQRRGYATEASEAIVDAAFAAGFERLTAMTFPTTRRRCTSWRSSTSHRKERRPSRAGSTRSSCVSASASRTAVRSSGRRVAEAR